MGSTYHSLHYHWVCSTKERRPFIRPEWRPRLHEYLGGTVRGLEGVPLKIGGVQDHVHALIGLKPTHCFSDFVRELKGFVATATERVGLDLSRVTRMNPPEAQFLMDMRNRLQRRGRTLSLVALSPAAIEAIANANVPES